MHLLTNCDAISSNIAEIQFYFSEKYILAKCIVWYPSNRYINFLILNSEFLFFIQYNIYSEAIVIIYIREFKFSIL